jgi:hypothetical protein
VADTLDTATPRSILVDSGDGRGARNPDADEAIAVSDSSILSVAAPDANGAVFVSGLVDGSASITVSPGAADANSSAGSDDITVTTAAVLTPLTVSLG